MFIIEPLVPNPGGAVDPDDLVGREQELDDLLRAVSHGGAFVLGDRRMGKTSLLRKLRRTLADVGHAVVFVSAEVDSVEALGEELLVQLRREQPLARGWSRWEKELGGEVSVDIAGNGLKLTAKATRSADDDRHLDLLDLCSQAATRAGKARVVLLIDEITTLAMRLRDRGDDPAVFLSSLRNARQTHDNVSIVLAGSVGLHHAVDDPVEVNDLPTLDVGPLAPADAVLLARRLLRNELGDRDDEAEIARRVADACSGIAFYIQSLVPVVAASADPGGDPRALVLEAIRRNDWKTDHYLDRLPRYYGPDAEVVEILLDGFAAAPGGLSLDQAKAGLDAAELDSRPSRRELGLLLRRVALDHYLVPTAEGYRFATELLRTIWVESRTRR